MECSINGKERDREMSISIMRIDLCFRVDLTLTVGISGCMCVPMINNTHTILRTEAILCVCGCVVCGGVWVCVWGCACGGRGCGTA